MEVSIEVYEDVIYVKVNGKIIGKWTYLDGAIETARKEIIARYNQYK